MVDVSQNNKRIAKNTLFLYMRQFLIMGITLYTSRVVLRELGVLDYGIYNVVGGVVALIGVLNSSMSVASQRYITYEMGQGNIERLRSVFNSSFFIYCIISIALLVLGESIGMWFIDNHMVIPDDRINAAHWVFQFSLFACINTMLSNPYNACIIAHEHMNVYAYISVLEVILKLLVVYLLSMVAFDKLIAYAILILACQFIVAFMYRWYCIKHFQECRISFSFDKATFKQLLSFSGWNFMGSFASLLKTQGLNIVLNMFFSPVINASRGIAVQVNNAVSQFFSNFYTAFRPQIIKYYAQNDIDNMVKLVSRSSLYSYYLMLFITLPILLETPAIIHLWLGQTPDYVVSFTRLIVLITVCDAMSNPLMTVVQAVGNLKRYQAVLTPIILLNIPLSYIALLYGFSPNTVFYISLCLSFICLIVRLIFVKYFIRRFSLKKYLCRVYGRCVLVTIAAMIMPLCLYIMTNKSLMQFFMNVVICVICSSVSIYLLGMSRAERDKLNKIIKNRLNLIKNG